MGGCFCRTNHRARTPLAPQISFRRETDMTWDGGNRQSEVRNASLDSDDAGRRDYDYDFQLLSWWSMQKFATVPKI